MHTGLGGARQGRGCFEGVGPHSWTLPSDGHCCCAPSWGGEAGLKVVHRLGEGPLVSRNSVGLSDFASETPSLPACELGLVRGNRVPQLGR